MYNKRYLEDAFQNSPSQLGTINVIFSKNIVDIDMNWNRGHFGIVPSVSWAIHNIHLSKLVDYTHQCYLVDTQGMKTSDQPLV